MVLAAIMAWAVVVGSVVMDAGVFMHRVRVVMMERIHVNLGGLGRYRGASRRAGHGHRHRAPDGEQHGKQNQEPDAEELHREKRIRRTVTVRIEATI